MEHGHSLPQEERGAYFGRVFVLLALIEAGKVKTEVCSNCNLLVCVMKK